MDIGKPVICRRFKQYEAEQNGQPSIPNLLTADQQRIRLIEQKNRQRRIDVTIKNASASFAQEINELSGH